MADEMANAMADEMANAMADEMANAMADEMANAMADDVMHIDIYSDESGNSPERQEQDDQQSVTSTNMSVATHQIGVSSTQQPRD